MFLPKSLLRKRGWEAWMHKHCKKIEKRVLEIFCEVSLTRSGQKTGLALVTVKRKQFMTSELQLPNHKLLRNNSCHRKVETEMPARKRRHG